MKTLYRQGRLVFLAAAVTLPPCVSAQDAGGYSAATEISPSIAPGNLSEATACYPFDQPEPAVLRASGKKVFAWYFPSFPLSLHNESPESNWYERWMDPQGGNGQYRDTGGMLRDRPLPVPQRTEPNWKQLNFETEIRQAIAIGLDGFILEMSHRRDHPDDRWDRVAEMLAAAQAVDPGFRILLAPGFPKETDATPDELADTLLEVAGHPSVFRLPDGRLPLVTFYPERPKASGGKPISWWRQLFDTLGSHGVDTAWYPMFLSPSSMNSLPDLADWYSTIEGYSRWDGRWESQASSNVTEQERAQGNGVRWMARAAFQDVRVRKGGYIELRHWEASNSGTLRAFFERGIESGADWLTVLTWNDYSETQVAPSQARGYAVADLLAYYTAWFKAGAAPQITRDALYYFHRRQQADAPFDRSLQTAGEFTIPAGPAAEDSVELLAFLAEPGQLVIRQGESLRTLDAGAGMTSFKVPLVPGTRPHFELYRNGSLIESLTSRTQVEASVDYQDLTYYAGGSIACQRPLPLPLED